eukprot:2241672-Alexandrium_andersonii.AAC.1
MLSRPGLPSLSGHVSPGLLLGSIPGGRGFHRPLPAKAIAHGGALATLIAQLKNHRFAVAEDKTVIGRGATAPPIGV